MDTSEASAELVESNDAKNVEIGEENVISTEKLESLVTSEQILSANVARRRRTLSKKPSNRPRDQTPGRDAVFETTTDDELINKRPKTPERRRRKSGKLVVEKSEPLKIVEKEIRPPPPPPSTTTTTIVSRESIPKQSERKKKESLVSITQAEVISFFNKAKRTLQSGKDTASSKKTSKVASRSQSVPSQFSEKDLIERLQKANLLNGDQRKPSYQNLSSDSSDLSSYCEEKPRPPPKPYRPIVREFVAKRKQQRQASAKIIEILDPKTAKVIGKIAKGAPARQRVGLFGFLTIFRHLTIREIFRVYGDFKNENKREYDKLTKLRNRCFTNFVLLMIYCGLGGIMFKYVEGAFENFYKCGVKRVKRDFIDVLWYRSHNLREDEWKSLARNKLRNFEEELHAAHEAGMHSYSGKRAWSFMNGIAYCLTIVTTIGYGHMYPTTITGMVLTIVYAIIGIPLFLIALTDFGKLFTRGIKFVWSFVRRLYFTGSCRSVRKTAHVEDILQGAQMMYQFATLRRPSMFKDPDRPEEDPENPKSADSTLNSTVPTTPAPSNFEIDDEFNLPISVAIFILVLYMFLGAVMYCILEQWDFFVAFYFVFISMSTIGFGDYVPSNPICMIASVFYLVFGLALMSMCINVVQVKLSDTFKGASTKMGATIGVDVNDDDGSIATVTPSVLEVPDVHVTLSPYAERPNNVSKKDLKSSMKIKSDYPDNEGESDKSKLNKEVKF